MTWEERLGPPIDDGEEPASRQPSRCKPFYPEDEQITASAPRRHVWPLLVAAFVAGTLGGWLVATMAASQPPANEGTPSAQLQVASSAELFTSLYLTGTSGEEIAHFFAGEPPLPSGTWVSHTAAVAIDQIDTDRWDVTVAVDSLEAFDERFESVPLGFYLVPMAVSGGRAMAIGAPARVPAPEIPTLAPDALYVVPGDQAAMATRFVELHLHADPEAEQLLAAFATVAAFAEPPYSSVVTEAVGVDPLGRVIVSARATTEKGAIHHLEYMVTLGGSELGWRVTAIGPAAR